jgi:hypothetical protein
MRTIRRVVSEVVALRNAQSQGLVDKLENACLTVAMGAHIRERA